LVGGRKRAHFFYLRLLGGGVPATEDQDGPALGVGIRGIDDILAAYGVRRFLERVDAGRPFRGGGIIGAILAWMAEEGFSQTMARYGLRIESPRAYRERFEDRRISLLIKSGMLHRH
jgi:hypothetical protein